MPSPSHVAARVMFTVRVRATRPQQTILLLLLMIISSTTVTVTVTVTTNTMITAETLATRHVPRGPQISCHA